MKFGTTSWLRDWTTFIAKARVQTHAIHSTLRTSRVRFVDPPSKLQHPPQQQLKMHDMKARATGNVRPRA
jgi:hypothetical protein